MKNAEDEIEMLRSYAEETFGGTSTAPVTGVGLTEDITSDSVEKHISSIKIKKAVPVNSAISSKVVQQLCLPGTVQRVFRCANQLDAKA